MEKFVIGVLVGGVCGALVATNNYKMRALIKKGQEEVQNKLDEMIDEKLQEMEEKTEQTVDDVKEKAKKMKDDMKKSVKKVAQN